MENIVTYTLIFKTFLPLSYIRIWLRAKSFQSCPTLWPYRLWPTRLLCPWDSPGKNTGVGCRALLQGIFLTQGSNPHLFCLLPLQAGSWPLVLLLCYCISTKWWNFVAYDIPQKESPMLLTGNHDCPASFMFSYYFFYRKYINLVSVQSTQYLAHKSNF